MSPAQPINDLRDPTVKQVIPELGKIKNASSEKARRMSGWTPLSNEDAIVATAQSLVRLGLLKDRAQLTIGPSDAASPALP